MPKLRELLFAACVAVLAHAAPRAGAQEPAPPAPAVSDTTVEVRLADGSVLYGRITGVDAERITLVTTGGGQLQVARTQVRAVRPVAGRIRPGGEFWPEDPHGTRLFFAPTGRNLQAGQGSFGVFELFLPFASYGVTDAFTLSGGTPVVPGASGQVAYAAPKLQVLRTEGAQVGLGVLAAFSTVDDLATAGLFYGVGTFGSTDHALTVGAALPFYADGDDGDVGRDPLVMLGGETRISRRLKIISENYFVPGDADVLLSGGLRFLGDRLTADFGVVGGAGACCLPLVNFVYTFGGR